MKVCVTASAAGLEAPVDYRFGRCAFFVVVDTDTMDAESVVNQSANAAGGAGIQAAQNIARLGVSALITGNVGFNAIETLSAAGIEVFQHQGGSVLDAVESFKRGELKRITTPSPSAGVGAGMGGGAGYGRGGGRGRGGGGRGGGRTP
jgi:predicted Fe-Mo cluster-binding NifX family protein